MKCIIICKSPTLNINGEGIGQVETLLALGLSADEVRDELQDLIPGLVDTYGSAAATLAADWYDDLRVEAKAPGRYRADVVVDLGAYRRERIARAVGWAVGPLFQAEPDVPMVLGRVLPFVSQEVVRPSRDTITSNLVSDDAAKGWQRVTSGGACRFCRMLASRGAVYRSESTGRFASHPGCHCAARPVWSDSVGPEADVVQHVASKRRKSPKDRARVRDYLNEVYPE